MGKVLTIAAVTLLFTMGFGTIAIWWAVASATIQVLR